MKYHPAGKPLFTRHGEEGALASFMALIQALAAFAADRGDAIQSIRYRQTLFCLAAAKSDDGSFMVMRRHSSAFVADRGDAIQSIRCAYIATAHASCHGLHVTMTCLRIAHCRCRSSCSTSVAAFHHSNLSGRFGPAKSSKEFVQNGCNHRLPALHLPVGPSGRAGTWWCWRSRGRCR